MELRWIKNGKEIFPGIEEGVLEIDFYPGIPMEVLFGSASPQSSTDEDERKWPINESNVAIKEILEDELTRKALFYNLHKSDLRVNCINLFHFTVREDKLNLYVFARSMNMKNMGYDLVTIDKIYNNVLAGINKEMPVKVDIGKVTVRINSLHYYKDETFKS